MKPAGQPPAQPAPAPRGGGPANPVPMVPGGTARSTVVQHLRRLAERHPERFADGLRRLLREDG